MDIYAVIVCCNWSQSIGRIHTQLSLNDHVCQFRHDRQPSSVETRVRKSR